MKRDDLKHLCGGGVVESASRGAQQRAGAALSGNKARKLQGVAAEMRFRLQRLPAHGRLTVASFGGYQSNSMAAISELVSLHRNMVQNTPAVGAADVEFVYFVRRGIPKWLRAAPSGNFAAALACNTHFVEVEAVDFNCVSRHGGTDFSIVQHKLSEYCDNLRGGDGDDCAASVFWIPQGAAMPEASAGIFAMVDEVVAEVVSIVQNSCGHSPNKWALAIASGSGTSALFAHQRVAYHNKCTLERVSQ